MKQQYLIEYLLNKEVFASVELNAESEDEAELMGAKMLIVRTRPVPKKKG